jgi:hypothetical protein
MSAKDARAGGAYVEVSLRSKVSEGAKQVQRELNSISKGLGTVGASLIGAGSATLAPVIASVVSFGKAGATFDDIAQRTGVSGAAISELAYAADMGGTSIESLERGLKKLQQTVTAAGDGSQSAVDALASVGLSIEDLAGKSGDQQLEVIADALSGISDPGERASRAMDLLGKAGSELMPMLSEGAKGLRAMREEAKALGIAMSDEDTKAAAAFDDALLKLWSTVKGVSNIVGASLAPLLTKVADAVTTIVSVSSQWVNQNRGLVVAIAATGVAAVAAGAGFMVLAGGLLVASMGITAFGTIATAVGAIVGVVWSPITAIVLGIAAAVAVWAAGFAYLAVQSGVAGDAITYLRSVFSGLAEIVSTTFGGISAALASGNTQLAAKIMWAGLKLIFAKASKEVVTLFINQFNIIGDAMRRIVVEAAQAWWKLPQLIASGMKNVVFQIGASLKGGSIQQLEEELKALTAEANAAMAPAKTGAGPAADNNGTDATASKVDPQKVFDERLQSLQSELIAMQAGADAVDLLTLKNQGLTIAQLAQVSALQEQRRALKLQQEMEEKRTQAAKDLVAEGKQLTESMRTPREQFVAEMTRIQELLQARAIDQTTADRAMQKAREGLNGGSGDRGSNGVALRGSQAAADTIRRNRSSVSAETWVAPLISQGLAAMEVQRSGFAEMTAAVNAKSDAMDLTPLEKLTEKQLAALGLSHTALVAVKTAIEESKTPTYTIP